MTKGSSSTERDAVVRQVDSLVTILRDGVDPIDVVTWRGLQFDAGLARVDHPVGCGGLSADPSMQGLVDTYLASSGFSYRSLHEVGDHMVADVLVGHATHEQRRRWLRPIYTGEELWCQLFSEPGAGSDLASASCRAEPDGGRWRVSGQKVWVTLAHRARWGLLLARHDRSALKHQGLSMFVVDMHAEGVEIRPLRQMTGDCAFDEVFLDDVLVAAEHVLGALGEGWSIVRSMLQSERDVIGNDLLPLAAAFDAINHAPHAHVGRRHELIELWCRAETIRHSRGRMADVGGADTVLKIQYTEALRDLFDLVVDLMGPEGVLYPNSYAPAPRASLDYVGEDPRWAFLHSRGRTIGAGTSEVLRNVLAERVLGLPPEPRIT